MTRASDLAKLLGAGATILDGTTISTADNTDQLTLTSTDADANNGPNLRLYRNSSSPANSDLVGNIDFEARNNNSQDVVYGSIEAQISDLTDGAEHGSVFFKSMIGGTLQERFRLNDTSVVFNEGSIDSDFRVESNGDANCLFVDGGNDRVGIGTNSPASKLHLKANSSGGTAQSRSAIIIEDDDGNSDSLQFLSNNSGFQSIFFGDAADNDVGRIAYSHSGNSMRFNVNAAERMRIDASGYIYVNTDGAEPSGSQVGVSIKGTQGQNFWKSANSGTGGYDHLVFFNGNGRVGSIYTSSSSTTYSTSSDYRLKENVTYDFDATSRLKQLKPSRFNFIADADTTIDGFLAHEVSSIVPEAITGTKDGTEDLTNVVLNADGTVNSNGVSQADWTSGKSDETYANDTTWVASKTVPKYQGIDQSKLVPLLVKTIQELEARITALESA